MLKRGVGFALAVLLLLGGEVAMAGQRATQNISITIPPRNELAITGKMGSLNPATPPAGSDFAPVSDPNTSYSYSTNGAAVKITAGLDSAMPPNTTLQLLATDLAKAGGGGSAGAAQPLLTLSGSPQDLVNGISKSRGTATLLYTFTATLDADPGPISRRVTLTIGGQ